MLIDAPAPPQAEEPHSASVSAGWTVRTWLSLVSLALTVFALVFSELLPAGILPPVAVGLGLSEGLAGQVVTATAIAAIISALMIGFVIGRLDRRRAMLGLCVLAIAANATAALAPNFVILLLARAVLGLAIGGFWSLSSAVVSRLVTIHSIGRGMAVILVGISAGTILAPSLGALIAEFVGWRAAFAVAAVASGVALLASFATLPRLPTTDPARIGNLAALMKRRMFVIGLIAVLMIMGGHFAGFTYVRVALESITRLTPTHAAGLLLAFGIANFLGNPAFAVIVDRRLRLSVVGTSILIGVSALSLAVAGDSVWVATAAAVVWGFGFGGAPLVVQTWTARAAADHLEAMGGLLCAAYQAAIASGAAIGGAIVDRTGVVGVLYFTGILVLGAALLTLVRVREA
jgi:DHA1 family purine ribonucleoside efflux pump-like MFS transporter